MREPHKMTDQIESESASAQLRVAKHEEQQSIANQKAVTSRNTPNITYTENTIFGITELIKLLQSIILQNFLNNNNSQTSDCKSLQ